MFTDRLCISATLTIGGTTHEAPGGTVRACSLRLDPWGFEGTLTFAILADQDDDALIGPFTTQDLATIDLTVTGGLPTTSTTPEALTVRAIVTDKAVEETSHATPSGPKVWLREYTVHFADAARVLWSQHRPLVLATEQSVADVFEAQVASEIAFEATLDAATEQRPHVFLPLGGQRASFYDLLAWYADTHAGVLTWDYAAGKLSLAATKPEGATPSKLRSTEVAGLSVRLPAVRRHAARVLNSYAESPATVELAQEQAVAGITHDHVMRSPVPADADARQSLEGSRLGVRPPELEVRFSAFPTVPWWPGTATQLQAEFYASALLPQGEAWRVAHVSLDAEAADDLLERDWKTDGRRYETELTAVWEGKSDPVPRLPPYAAPRWPVHVEGRIVCEVGNDGDRTWSFEEDADTSVQSYKVRVPLWDCVVKAPFQPIFLPGHVYAPAWRDSRVLLALHLHDAEIVQFLDWGASVQMPLESQGNQVLFGKNGQDQTALSHAYVDNKPVFTVYRVKDSDTELLQMEEGVLVLQTKEET